MMHYKIIAEGQSYPVEQQPLRIGRSSDNDVVLRHPAVSRQHATVWIHQGQLYVRDEGSANGTWLNGRQIQQPTPLKPGDRLQVGELELSIEGREVPAPGAVAPVAPQPAVQTTTRKRRWVLPAILAFVAVLILGGIVFVWQDGFGLLRASPLSGNATEEPTVLVEETPTEDGVSNAESSTPTPTDSAPTETSQSPTSTPTRAATALPTSTPTETPPPCLPDADFVDDISVVDGTEFSPGESFRKIWKMASSGCAAWPADTQWVFISGDQLGAPAAVDVSSVSPGDTFDVGVEMVAPTTPGTYKGFWQLQSGDGRRFGDKVYVLIVVPDPKPTPDNRSTVSILIKNETGGNLTLQLSGPASYKFTFEPGETTVTVVPGSYDYTVWGCGTISSGLEDISEGMSDWRFWCESD